MIVAFIFGYLSIREPETISLGGRSMYTSASNCTATTSPKYMTGGTATTTITLLGGSSYVTTNYLVRSSTTPPTLGYRFEASEDGVDWYTISTPTNELATTTIVTQADQRWTFASSTSGS